MHALNGKCHIFFFQNNHFPQFAGVLATGYTSFAFMRDVQVGRINLPFLMRSAKYAIEKYGGQNWETQSVRYGASSCVGMPYAWCRPPKSTDAHFIWAKKNVTSDCRKNVLTVSISLGCRDLRRKKRWRDEIFIVIPNHGVDDTKNKLFYPSASSKLSKATRLKSHLPLGAPTGYWN